MTEYFIRFSACEEWLQCDLKRGYSFHGYNWQASVKELLEEAGYDLDENDVEALAEELNVCQHTDGRYGFALNGLCGYGPFECLEDAKEAAQREGGYLGYTVCGIFAGHERGLDPDCNAVFAPSQLIEIFDAAKEAVVA
jgi:hypothetical protein